MSTGRRTNRMSSRARRRRREAWGDLFILLLGAFFVYFALASSAGRFIAEKLIAPIFRSLRGEEKVQSTLSLSPQSSEEFEKRTDEIKISARNFYALSFGAFASMENAEKLALNVKSRSGGGYIYKNGDVHRVIAAVYGSESDAKSVREQLMEDNSADSSVYRLSVPSLTLKVTAASDNLKAVKDGFSAAGNICEELLKLPLLYDLGEMTTEELCGKPNELEELAEDPVGLLSNTGSPEARELKVLLSGMAADLNNTAKSITENSLEFSALLKYTQIKEICAYTDFICVLAA